MTARTRHRAPAEPATRASAGLPGRPAGAAPRRGRAASSWPPSTACASARSRCAAPTWPPGRPRSSTCPAAPPWRPSARRAPSGPAGCGRSRSARAGTAPTNRSPGPDPATDEQRALIEPARAPGVRPRPRAERDGPSGHQVADLDDGIAEVEQAIAAEGPARRHRPATRPRRRGPGRRADRPRRIRSTRRRQDVPDLPRQKVDPRTVGRTYTGPDGTVHQPSMWLTLTLDSYGPVHSIPARPAVHLPPPAQPTTTRCSAPRSTRPRTTTGAPPGTPCTSPGCSTVLAEPAPRGRLERPVRRLRRAATPARPARPLRHPRHHPPRHAATRSPPPPTTRCGGRPPTDRATPLDRPPVWDADASAWIDPDTRTPLPTWARGPRRDRRRPGRRAGARRPVRAAGQGQGRRARHARTSTAPSATSPSTSPKTPPTATPITSDPQREHLDRLWHELRVTPCSDRCANWLLYGIQPKKAHDQAPPRPLQRPGPPADHPRHRRPPRPRSPATGPAKPSPTTAPTPAPGSAPSSASATSADQTDAGRPTSPATPAPVAWEMARPDDPDLPPLEHRLLRAISTRIQRRRELDAARERAAQYLADRSATAAVVRRE